MKRRILTAVFLILILSAAAACSPAEQEPVPLPEPENGTEEPAESELPNPMEEMSELDFDEKLGWSINGWPEDYAFEHAYVVAGAVGQVDFKVDGNAVAFRTADEMEGDVSGVYDAFAVTETSELDGIPIELRYTKDEAGLAIWYKDGYVHTLYMKSGASFDSLMEIAERIDKSIAIGPWLEK